MANPWFRLYAEFATDPKVQMMPEAMQRRLILLFCLQCSEVMTSCDPNERDEAIAFAMRISAEDMQATKEAFMQRGFIDEAWRVLNWWKRQYASDSSAPRVKKYRDKRKEMGLTANGYTKHDVTVTERDGHACVYCGSEKNLCIDHVLPVSQGGDDDLANLVCSCKACNSGKAGRTPKQAKYQWLNKVAESRWGAWMESRSTCNGYSNGIEQNRTEQNRTELSSSTELDVIDNADDAPKKANGCPVTKIVALYHERLPTLPRVEKLTDARRQRIQQRWREDLPSLDHWGNYFDDIKASPFLMGKATPSPGRRVFMADIDFLTTASNFAKIAEGKFHR